MAAVRFAITDYEMFNYNTWQKIMQWLHFLQIGISQVVIGHPIPRTVPSYLPSFDIYRYKCLVPVQIIQNRSAMQLPLEDTANFN